MGSMPSTTPPTIGFCVAMSNLTVDGKGGERAVHDLPPEEEWRWERFVVVELTEVGLSEDLTLPMSSTL
jgi:hypothetical protein